MLNGAVSDDKIHGLIFDGAMFLGNIALIGYLPRLGDDVADTTAGALMLLAVLTQTTGAWWKKGYLGLRLANRRSPLPQGFAKGFMNILLFLHFLLFSVITLLALALLGIYEIESSESIFRGDIWVPIALIIGGITTAVVRRAGIPDGSGTRMRIRRSWLEYGADGLLWVSVTIVTRTFWDSLVLMIEPSRGIGFSVLGIVLIVAVFLLFVFLYLPSRYLFLVEDYDSLLTWVQVFVAMLPVIWLVIVG